MVAAGAMIRAPSIFRSRICRRAVAASATARVSSGSPGSFSSRVTACWAMAAGATTPKGTSFGRGSCSAPT